MPKYFGPGGGQTTTRKIITYAAFNDKACLCDSNDDNKVKKDSTNYNGLQVSTAQYNANLLKLPNYGGRTQFGNYNTTNSSQLTVNSLGRVQGQPGGSGKPPRNKLF